MSMKTFSLLLITYLTFIALFVSGATELVDEKSKSTILVSTIDGYLSAIDVATGTIKWRYNEGSVLNAPRSVQRDFSYIPNPRTGELYTIVDKQLNKLPFTIPQLVTISPCRSTNGILYSGYKKDVWIAINPETGVHRETVPPQNISY